MGCLSNNYLINNGRNFRPISRRAEKLHKNKYILLAQGTQKYPQNLIYGIFFCIILIFSIIKIQGVQK